MKQNKTTEKTVYRKTQFGYPKAKTEQLLTEFIDRELTENELEILDIIINTIIMPNDIKPSIYDVERVGKILSKIQKENAQRAIEKLQEKIDKLKEVSQ